MAKVSCFISVFAVLLLVAAAGGQEIAGDQPSLWSTKPDVAAFEKMENGRLTAAQAAVDQVVAAKGTRTIENTLVPYDEAIRQLNAAIYFSSLMQQVHPDAAFRDHATAMTTKVSSAQTALSLNHEVYQALTSLKPGECRRGDSLLCAAAIIGVPAVRGGQRRCDADAAQEAEPATGGRSVDVRPQYFRRWKDRRDRGRFRVGWPATGLHR